MWTRHSYTVSTKTIPIPQHFKRCLSRYTVDGFEKTRFVSDEMWIDALGDGQIHCRCSKWSLLAAAQAVKRLVKFATALVTCSCGSFSQMICVTIFTALHVMQTRYSEESSVCPSVCPSVRLSVRPSHAWSLTKWKKDRSRFLYHTKEHLA